MEIVLIILTSAIISALLICSFLFGYYVRSKKPTDEGLTLTEHNRDFVEEMAKWRQFVGK